jgi:hypothetical protein
MGGKGLHVLEAGFGESPYEAGLVVAEEMSITDKTLTPEDAHQTLLVALEILLDIGIEVRALRHEHATRA